MSVGDEQEVLMDGTRRARPDIESGLELWHDDTRFVPADRDSLDREPFNCDRFQVGHPSPGLPVLFFPDCPVDCRPKPTGPFNVSATAGMGEHRHPAGGGSLNGEGRGLVKGLWNVGVVALGLRREDRGGHGYEV